MRASGVEDLVVWLERHPQWLYYQG